MGYSYTPNWAASRNAHDKYDFYIRRSFNGGSTWTTDPDAEVAVEHTDILSILMAFQVRKLERMDRHPPMQQSIMRLLRPMMAVVFMSLRGMFRCSRTTRLALSSRVLSRSRGGPSRKMGGFGPGGLMKTSRIEMSSTWLMELQLICPMSRKLQRICSTVSRWIKGQP